MEVDAGRLMQVVLEDRPDRVALDDRQSRSGPRAVEAECRDRVLDRVDPVLDLVDRESKLGLAVQPWLEGLASPAAVSRLRRRGIDPTTALALASWSGWRLTPTPTVPAHATRRATARSRRRGPDSGSTGSSGAGRGLRSVGPTCRRGRCACGQGRGGDAAADEHARAKEAAARQLWVGDLGGIVAVQWSSVPCIGWSSILGVAKTCHSARCHGPQVPTSDERC